MKHLIHSKCCKSYTQYKNATLICQECFKPTEIIEEFSFTREELEKFYYDAKKQAYLEYVGEPRSPQVRFEEFIKEKK